jgi:hypothetical protein
MNVLLILLANAITMLIDLATLYLAFRLFAGPGGIPYVRWSGVNRGRIPTHRFCGLFARVRQRLGFLSPFTQNQKFLLGLVFLFLLRCLFAVNIRIGA